MIYLILEFLNFSDEIYPLKMCYKNVAKEHYILDIENTELSKEIIVVLEDISNIIHTAFCLFSYSNFSSN